MLGPSRQDPRPSARSLARALGIYRFDRKAKILRWVVITIALFSIGCSTFSYKSARTASAVSECIVKGWENSGATSIKVPVSITIMDTELRHLAVSLIAQPVIYLEESRFLPAASVVY